MRGYMCECKDKLSLICRCCEKEKSRVCERTRRVQRVTVARINAEEQSAPAQYVYSWLRAPSHHCHESMVTDLS